VSAAVSVEVTLPGSPASVPAARRFVRTTLRSWQLELLVDTASLIVSELAANAVLHARSPFTVRVARTADGQVRIEVVDRSARQPERRSHGVASTTGRGLSIIEELATDWGVEVLPDGKAVWVHISVHGARSRTGVAPPPGARGRGRRGDPDPSGPRVRAA
jgi:anti-sigma regulatory factor (Ser/Thr protein kinase)